MKSILHPKNAQSFSYLNSQDGDIFVSPDHPIHLSEPWTQQSQGCQRPGDFIYLPRSFIQPKIDEEEEENKRNISYTTTSSSTTTGINRYLEYMNLIHV